MKSIGWLGDAEDILSEIYLAVGHYPETARDISEYIIRYIDERLSGALPVPSHPCTACSAYHTHAVTH